MQQKIEIVILSGFLGSGKTTLLQNLLVQEQKNGRHAAVLMNEIGEVSIDGNLLPPNLSIEEITNGCICCTGKDQLERGLLALYTTKRPDVIYIENSGLAHPLDVVDACLSPIIAKDIDIKSVITVLDSVRWCHRNEYSKPVQRLMEEQVKYADQLLINKVDLIQQQTFAEIIEDIQNIQPHIDFQMTTFARMELNTIQPSTHESPEEHQHLHVHHHLHTSHLVYTFTKSIEKNDFEAWVRQLPLSVFRIKGFVRFKDTPTKTTLFQYAYGVPMHIDQEIAFPTNLVIIEEHLDIENLTKQLRQLESQNF